MNENFISLDSFAKGALREKFNLAFEEVIENLTDLNTSPEILRKLTLELNFTTDEERSVTPVEIIAKTKLAHQKGVSTTMLIGKDSEGKAIADEWDGQIDGQTDIEEYEDKHNNVTELKREDA